MQIKFQSTEEKKICDKRFYGSYLKLEYFFIQIKSGYLEQG